MSMFLAPYTAIADTDGRPLDAGFLYLGEYGKDPASFPVEVFWDEDFTVPAAQPIRTRNGYPVRNGGPAKIYIKVAKHSIAIKNRKGAFVFVDFYNKGFDASFLIDGDKDQKQINFEVKTYLDNFPFYIPYSPLVSDYGSQFKTALESDRPIVLTQDAVYPFLTKVDAAVTKGVQITGNFATLSYEGASHIGDFISIKGSTPLKHYFYSLNVDGKHKATRVFYLQSGQPNTEGTSYAFFNNCHATRAKRSTEFVSLGGEAISIRGAFSSVDLEYSKVSDCILGVGAGVSGSVGIRGLGVTDLNANSYPLELNLTSCTVDTVYSEDPTYTMDQDGVVFFGANDLTIKSIANITALTANNCWGRSIKTQCRTTVVTGGTYTRSMGNSTGEGGSEIGIQMGNGIVKGAVFKYSNGAVPATCIDISATTAISRSGLLVEGCDVVLDSNTVLPAFVTSFPRTSKIGLIEAKGNKIYGKARNFASLRYRGNRNIIEISGNYVEEIVQDAALENQRNFAVFRSSGTPPAGETTTAEVTLLNNINDGPEAYLVRDGVSGSSMITTQNGRGNVGFVDVGTISGSAGQKSLVPLRATAFAGKDSSVSYTNTGVNIAAGATAQVTVPNNTQLVAMQVRGQANTTVLISHGANGGILSQIGTGAVVYSTGTSLPETEGTWLTIWRDASDNNKLNIKNNNPSNRFVGVHCFTA